MPYSSSTGIYTSVAGATSATAGQTIASATWNSINSDVATCLNQIGPANLPYMNGAKIDGFLTAPQTINFAASAGDIGIFAIASILPPSVTTYFVSSVMVGNAQGNLNSVVVSLYTAASAGGTAVIGSTTVTVTTSVSGTAGNLQFITGPGNIAWNAPSLYLHITTSTATSNKANVALTIGQIF